MTAERHAAVIKLRSQHEAEYRRLHADVWAAVLAQIRKSGIANYSIFLRDGMLFSYYEYMGDDHAGDLAAMADDPETRRWWELTDPCQQPIDTAAEGERWAPMTEVFHTE